MPCIFQLLALKKKLVADKRPNTCLLIKLMNRVHRDPRLHGITLDRTYHHLTINLHTGHSLKITAKGITFQNDILCTVDNLLDAIVGSKTINTTVIGKLKLRDIHNITAFTVLAQGCDTLINKRMIFVTNIEDFLTYTCQSFKVLVKMTKITLGLLQIIL